METQRHTSHPGLRIWALLLQDPGVLMYWCKWTSATPYNQLIPISWNSSSLKYTYPYRFYSHKTACVLLEERKGKLLHWRTGPDSRNRPPYCPWVAPWVRLAENMICSGQRAMVSVRLVVLSMASDLWSYFNSLTGSQSIFPPILSQHLLILTHHMSK